MSSLVPFVQPHIFKAIEKSDIHNLSLCEENEIRPILPCLVRMSLISPFDPSEVLNYSQIILYTLSGIEAVNHIVDLLSQDFSVLEADVKREQALRQKPGGTNSLESVLVQGTGNGLALDFECADAIHRLKLLLSELLLIMAQIKEPRIAGSSNDVFPKPSELFDNWCYLEETSDVLCIALAELPSLLPPADVAEALLQLAHGPAIIAKMVANQPDCFREVWTGMVLNGEKQDEESACGQVRLLALRTLCKMNPLQAASVRALCVEHCVMPALCIYLTLDMTSASLGESVTGEEDEVVAFVTGVLIGSANPARSWFAQYIRGAARRKSEQQTITTWSSGGTALSALRAHLVDRLRSLLLLLERGNALPERHLLRASAIVRLYCALKCIAGLKLKDDSEASLLARLATCRPPPSEGGARFAWLGLCALIACPAMLAAADSVVADWIKGLVDQDEYFCSSSLGSLLLLVAIHLHLQQSSAVMDLVSSSLGMKVSSSVLTTGLNTTSTQIRGSGCTSLVKIRHIFTQEVFTEQVVAAQAAKIAVTKGLSGSNSGFLPVHCIYHQLKSRMFTKHKVSIKAWIYKQICQATTPLHPILPHLLEVYVTSILIPPTDSQVKGLKADEEGLLNEPISEEEVLAVFSLTLKAKGVSHLDDEDAGSIKYLRSKIRGRNTRLAKTLKQSGHNGALSRANVTKPLHNSTPPNTLEVCDTVTSQLLLLYYLLLYEDTRLTQLNNQFIGSSNGGQTYSPKLFAQLPVRYLLSSTQRHQKLYAGVFSSLLKMLATHYPQLCLLEDWIYEPPSSNDRLTILTPRLALNSSSLSAALQNVDCDPASVLILLNRMLQLAPSQMWQLAVPFTAHIKCLLKKGVPRKVLDTYKVVWLSLNSVYPRRLWVLTVEGLRPNISVGDTKLHLQLRSKMMQQVDRKEAFNDGRFTRIPLTEDEIVVDPLYVLRCDLRVFRCAPILEIVTYMLQVYLLSSRAMLAHHVHQSVNGSGDVLDRDCDREREKLRGALLLTQESAAVQILLEACLKEENPKRRHDDVFAVEVKKEWQEEEGEGRYEEGGSEFVLQEVRSVVCSFLHQMFIRDPTLAKLVHFQGYCPSLLRTVVEGVPSMHIAASWVTELLQWASLAKQAYSFQLAARLALQNAMPDTLGMARLILGTVGTLIAVVSQSEQRLVVRSSLRPLVRIGRAFPTLLEDCVTLFVTFGRVAAAKDALAPAPSPKVAYHPGMNDMDDDPDMCVDVVPMENESAARSAQELSVEIRAAFQALVREAGGGLY